MMRTGALLRLLCLTAAVSGYGVASYAEESPAAGGSSDAAAASGAGAGDSGSATSGSASASSAPAAPAASTSDAARDALKQKSDDASKEKNLEQIFNAAEKSYSLLKTGKMSASYSLSYSFFRDDRVDVGLTADGAIARFAIENDAQHSWDTSISVDYGIWDNLTFNARLPMVFKYDTEKSASMAALGDLSLGLRWQPVPVKVGLMNSTLFASLSTATGNSPYEIDTTRELSSGKGYYSIGTGLSVSKVLDPVVIYGSTSLGLNTNATGLNQYRGGRVLESVEPGQSLSFSMGMAYSLSYDISMNYSFQQSYAGPTRFNFADGESATSKSSSSATFGMGVGVRVSPKTIVNIGMGIGLTEDTPDVSLDFSLPLDIDGFLGND